MQNCPERRQTRTKKPRKGERILNLTEVNEFEENSDGPNRPPVSEREDLLPTLEGTVSHITYRNESNGYTVCELDLGDDETVIVGILPGITEGELIRVQGKW